MIARYVIAAVAKNVVRKQRMACGHVVDRGLPTQRAQLDHEDLGWWITIGDVGFYLGNEEPDIKSGDAIRVIIEGVP